MFETSRGPGGIGSVPGDVEQGLSAEPVGVGGLGYNIIADDGGVFGGFFLLRLVLAGKGSSFSEPQSDSLPDFGRGFLLRMLVTSSEDSSEPN